MKVILFGGTGMIGQGVLDECLRDERVEQVLAVGRGALATANPKLRELVEADPTDLSAVAGELAEFDACFFCLGVSSVGMKEEKYRRITYDLTLRVARTLADANPGLTFIYVSGQGTDSTEQGRSMWGRVKGKTENDLLALPFRAYMFRPGFVQPMDGAVSKTPLYRAAYALTGPLIPLLKRLAPNAVNDNREIGRAMIAVAASGADTRVLTPREISARATP
ncbi:NAD-dependent epimerase/dehydratase family protein [Nocardia sp. SYP-A9097]|uniref:NAD-dependent epimerase/dehydratase family protein n=1 Tax=Nocardia sp. SYP-A9097 TaxID=2663237 RepID=UPI00129B7269|nr:NAD-dependent epimerase/dehydratase family protein [Nocardia sp. SYP-A9097]MRH87489.1 NAD-dependent epimerase/dehydratase family protein [Nocardia sp. SYP-A9097]